MKHYLFIREIHGVHVTIEINGGETAGSVGDTPIHTAIRINKGMNPHWSYQAGFDSPIWNEEFNYRYVSTLGKFSDITLLRMVVAYLSGNRMTGAKHNLGFHSKYKTMKRNLAA